jgi:hypothetical protein
VAQQKNKRAVKRAGVSVYVLELSQDKDTNVKRDTLTVANTFDVCLTDTGKSDPYWPMIVDDSLWHETKPIHSKKDRVNCWYSAKVHIQSTWRTGP